MQAPKTAIVTGGSSGIGRGIAIVLAEHGYDVAITYGGNLQGAQETAESVKRLGKRCPIFQADMVQADVPARIVNEAIAELGSVGLMVNNAGRTIHHSVLTVTAEQMEYIYGLNFRAYILGAGAAARHMVRNNIKGNIIFITSTRGERAYAEDLLYGGLKAGINRACQSMALDLAPYGIRVNCVAPGATAVREDRPITGTALSDAIPLGRIGTPRDNGELIAFLASDKASYITGSVIRVDGGLILPGMMEGSATPGLVHGQTKPEWFTRVREELDQFES